MKERPIQFNDDMVCAILDNRKTMTRRPVKFSDTTQFWNHPAWKPVVVNGEIAGWRTEKAQPGENHFFRLSTKACPHGAPGDRLWVQETWASVGISYDWETGYSDDIYPCDSETVIDYQKALKRDYDTLDASKPSWAFVYAADGGWDTHKDDRGFNWRPSIHMPRWASRILLEITDVRVERLQDITWQDVLAEGVKHKDAWWLGALHPIKDTPKVYPLAAQAYESLWDSIYAAKHPWASNPWVWAITFRRVEA